MKPHVRTLLFLAAALSFALPGCNLAPPETAVERQHAEEIGRPYTQPHETRILQELSAEPTWQDILHRAFLTNGELEAAYWEWQAAIERADMAGTYPNSNIQLGFEYMFSGGRMKAWDRTTLSAGFDPSMTLRLPEKTRQAARVALAEAQAAGMRLQAAKFDLQRRVLVAWLDYALMAEKLRIATDNVALLELLVHQAGDRVQTGAPQQDLLKAQMQFRLARNDVANMQAQLDQMRAMLNGMLARNPDAPLAPPATLPAPRSIPGTDADLLAAAVDLNPELAALAAAVRGRKDALELAKLAYIPDIQPSFSINGNISQALGAMVMLPTALPMIEGQIKEARAMLAGSQAMAEQTRSDRAASFVATLYALRNAERAGNFLTNDISPLARQVLASSRDAYASGQVSFAELIASQRELLDVRQVMAEVRIERERRLAELEALAGVDVETLGNAPTPAQLSTRSTPSSETAHVH
jgi:outer membrane protein, heavy metal efflux system